MGNKSITSEIAQKIKDIENIEQEQHDLSLKAYQYADDIRNLSKKYLTENFQGKVLKNKNSHNPQYLLITEILETIVCDNYLSCGIKAKYKNMMLDSYADSLCKVVNTELIDEFLFHINIEKDNTFKIDNANFEIVLNMSPEFTSFLNAFKERLTICDRDGHVLARNDKVDIYYINTITPGIIIDYNKNKKLFLVKLIMEDDFKWIDKTSIKFHEEQ